MDKKSYRAAGPLWRLMLLSLAVIGAALLSSATASADVARATASQGAHAGVRGALSGEKDKGSIREEKSEDVQKATAALAKGIRSNNRFSDWVVRNLNDDAALQAFRKFASKIADQLLSIASIPGLSRAVVKEKVKNYMIGLGVGGGSALIIAEAIEVTIPLVIVVL